MWDACSSSTSPNTPLGPTSGGLWALAPGVPSKGNQPSQAGKRKVLASVKGEGRGRKRERKERDKRKCV